MVDLILSEGSLNHILPAADKGDGAYRERRIALRDEGRGGHSKYIARRDNRHRRTCLLYTS